MGDIVLRLGNSAPTEVHKPERVEDDVPVWGAKARGEVVGDWLGRGPHMVHALDVTESNQTTVVVHADTTVSRAVRDIGHGWDYHSTQQPGWVTIGDDGGDPHKAALLKAMVEDHFRLPTPDGATMLTTNGGLDYASAQLGGAASATAIAKYVAITANSTAPAATDTTLTGEIITAGGGLVRAAATYAHTAGASNYTLSVTFTANASDVLPVTVDKCGIFTASSGGTMVFEDTFTGITFNASGDSGQITETVTV